MVMDMEKINMTYEGANTLREFGATIQQTILMLQESTEDLESAFMLHEEDFGVMADLISDLLQTIKRMQAEADEATEVLPKKLNEVADMMEAFISSVQNG